MTTHLAILLMAFALSNAIEPPEALKPCRKSDPEYAKCLNEVSATFVASLASGLKSFNILPIEPLAIDKISIGGTTGPVSLKQEYRNVKLHGLTKGFTTSESKVDFDKLEMYSESKNPHLEFLADYEIEGKVLILPVRGKGRANLTMVNLLTETTMQFEKYDKDGETYVKVLNYLVKFKPEKVIMNFDNLFDGDKTLGDQLNSFLDENSEVVFSELKGSFEETFGLIYKQICNKIFDRLPMKTLFPE